jgi:hypothetical protein
MVVDERAASDGQIARVGDAAPGAAAEMAILIVDALESLRRVVGQYNVRERQVGVGVVQDAAAVAAEGDGGINPGLPVGDRHPGHGHRPAQDVEDPAGIVAADRQPFGARTLDVEVVGDLQLAAGQGDGPVQTGGEGDHVGAGVGVSVDDGLAQRLSAAVAEVQDRECAEHGPIFQAIQQRSCMSGTPLSRAQPPG